MKKVKIHPLFHILAPLIWVFICTFASQFFLGLIFQIFLKEQLKQPIWLTIFSTSSYLLALLLTILIPKKIFPTWRTNREELGLAGLPTWTDIFLSPVGFTVYFILAGLFVGLFSIFPWFDVTQKQNVLFSQYIGGLDRIIAFFVLVILAPIAEELIFRGWLYGKLRARANLIISIFLTSLLFGLMHFQWNVGVNVFAMSIVLCGLREITGTIYSGIILHMLKNGLAFFLLFIIGVT